MLSFFSACCSLFRCRTVNNLDEAWTASQVTHCTFSSVPCCFSLKISLDISIFLHICFRAFQGMFQSIPEHHIYTSILAHYSISPLFLYTPVFLYCSPTNLHYSEGLGIWNSGRTMVEHFTGVHFARGPKKWLDSPYFPHCTFLIIALWEFWKLFFKAVTSNFSWRIHF